MEYLILRSTIISLSLSDILISRSSGALWTCPAHLRRWDLFYRLYPVFGIGPGLLHSSCQCLDPWRGQIFFSESSFQTALVGPPCVLWGFKFHRHSKWSVWFQLSTQLSHCWHRFGLHESSSLLSISEHIVAPGYLN